ncbi:hypothetical protein [Kitasatospora sp. SUK 42]|uniref:hypothetical protein n=1 Tax=Kitasatospora sp. SUK 42 TaxID=1588882 RepID=UPI0018C95123|nr:hypothetical protein [Kitasatospora sp. SUK 42]MBV2156446.1 hypothetical protein [Kitasatospora sp. SUK 42]
MAVRRGRRPAGGGAERADELEELLREAMDELGVVMPEQGLAERCLVRHLAAALTAGELTPKEAAAQVWQGMGESATEVEWRFVETVTVECCPSCLEEQETDNPEAFHAWERKLRAAAATLAVAEDDPRVGGHRR